MTERKLTTRDLAETQDEDASASEETIQESSRQDAGRERSRGTVPLDERTTADAPSAREQAEVDDEANDPPAGQRNEPRSVAAEASSNEERDPLLPVEQTDRFTEQWQEIQVGFVDEPRESVAKADALVADLMQRLAATFSDEREGLEAQWDRGDDISTEDLRVALKRYRSFFDRLLSA
jgi:hypothetical protein